MKTREAITAIEADGWVEQKGRGTGHRQWRHPTKPGKVTISFHGGNTDLGPRDVASISRQSGLNLKGK